MVEGGSLEPFEKFVVVGGGGGGGGWWWWCKPILVFSLGLSQAEQYDVTHLISSHGHTEVHIILD